MVEIDFETLRDYLMSYFGTAMTNGNPVAVIYLQEVEMASNEELLKMAQEIGMRLPDIPTY